MYTRAIATLLMLTGLSMAGAQSFGLLSLQPSSEQIYKPAGDSVFVTCKPDDSAQTVEQLQWTGPSGDVSSSSDARIHSEVGLTCDKCSSLIVSKVQNGDEGVYSCNGIIDGNDESATFELKIYEAIKIEADKEQSFEEYSDALVKCMVTGEPKPIVDWTWRGSSEKSDRFIETEDGLLIQNISRKDVGGYTCRARVSGDINDLKMFDIKVLVFYAPSFETEREESLSSWIGQSIEFTCTPEGHPVPKITWFKNGEELSPTSSLVIDTVDKSSTLKVILNSDEDFGDYTCEADNGIGVPAEKVFPVNQTFLPKNPDAQAGDITPTSVSIEISGPEDDGGNPVKKYNVEFKLKDEAWEDAGTKQFEIGQEQNIDGQYTFVVDGLMPASYYLFRVAAHNDVGTGAFGTEFSIQTEELPQTDAPMPGRNIAESDNGDSGATCGRLSVLTGIIMLICSTYV